MIRGWIFIAVFAVGIGAYAILRPSQPRIPVRIGTAPQVISSPLHIADVFGDFKRENLDVTVVSYPSGSLAMKALLANEVDAATVAETPLWHGVERHAPLVVWATLAETRRSLWIIAPLGRGIAVAADLAGKRVAVPCGTTAEVYLLSLLDLCGLTKADITLIDTPALEIEDALLSGAADAACIWEPYVTKIVRKFDQPTLLHEDFLFRMTWNLAGRKGDASVPVEAVLRGLDRANARMLTDDPLVVSEVARWCDLDPDVARRLIPDHHFCLQLESSLLMEVEQQARLVGGPKADYPNMLDLIDPQPLLRVLPEAVNIPIHAAR